MYKPRVLAMASAAVDQPHVTYSQGYDRLEDWVASSLERHKQELRGILFPLFTHCYFRLLSQDSPEAPPFFKRWAPEHAVHYGGEVRSMATLTTKELDSDPFASLVLALDPVSGYYSGIFAPRLCAMQCRAPLEMTKH